MAVDLKPAVGRILLLRGRSTEVFPWYEKGGKITRISGHRAYFTKEDGTESFTHEYSAIVDTEAEENRLLMLSAVHKTRLKQLIDSFHVEVDERVTELNKAAGMKSISTSRVRKAEPVVTPMVARRVRTRG